MRRFFLAMALAVIALSVSTCFAEDVLTSANMRKMMIDSAEDSQTYRFSLDANVISENIDLQNPGMRQSNTTTMTGQGAVNITSRAMAAAINYADGANIQSSKIYAMDDSLYMLQNDAWSKMGISSPDDLWSGQKIVKRQEDLVNLAQLTLDGSDEIKGDYCYRLNIVPDSDKGAELLALQISPMLASSFSSVNASSLFSKISGNTRIIGWKVWISRDGHLLRKSSIQAEITLTPEILETVMKGLGKNSIHMKIDSDVVYNDYNSGIEIHLPEEAKKATELKNQPTGEPNQPGQIGESSGGASSNPFGIDQPTGELSQAGQTGENPGVVSSNPIGIDQPTGELNQAGQIRENPGVVSSNPIGTDQQPSDSLAMYQEFYNFGQGTQTGPVRFDIYGAEPTYLIVNGQSRPYDPNYVPTDSLWIQGRASWAQYIKCPMNAQVMMLALSDGGPATMIETYADGRQEVNQYYFYPGYTKLVFAANALGRHTLSFYINGHYSNTIVFDVIPYGGSYVSGYTSTAGLPYSISGQNQGFGSNTFSGSGRILIDSSNQGFDPNAPPGGYSNTYTQSGRILFDSSSQGFDPLAPPIGEAI